MSTIDPEVLFRVPNVYNWGGGFDVSPDGRTLVFMWNSSGHWELYVQPLDGSTPPRSITAPSPDSKMFPRFSPDGTRVAYLQDYDGDENFDVFVVDVATGVTRNLMPDTPEGLNEWLRWSPDGQWIYHASNREKDFAIFAVNVADGSFKRLTHHAASDMAAEPSPDGRWLAVMAETDGQNSAIYLIPTEGGEERCLGLGHGVQDAGFPDWSPDSQRLAFVSADQGMYDIGVYDLAAQTVHWLTHADLEYYLPVWSPQGDRVLFMAHRAGDFVPVIHDGHSAHFLPVPRGIHNQLRFTPDGQQLVYTFSSAQHPPDLWVRSLTDDTARQLTHSLPPTVECAHFVQPTHVWYPSLDEGVNVPALLYLPPQRPANGARPGVLYVHGGPTGQHDNDWYPAVNYFVAQGYVVICPNYRGSTGYGKTFREANRFDLGRGDTNDTAAAADYLISANLADAHRIGITGISYGGFMTMTCVTQHPQKWAAGSAVVPFVNWFTEHASEREDLQYWDDQNMGDPVKDYDRWYANSPIYFIDRITCPIQLIAGGNDVRCPKEEAEQVRDKLIELGRPVEMQVYPDEGHILRQLANRVDAYRRRAAFFERYLAS